MKEYIKQRPDGLYVAKRGYCYYLYNSIDNILDDDEQVSHNLDRLNNNIPVFNRCYNGSWIMYSRKFSDIKRYMVQVYTKPLTNVRGFIMGLNKIALWSELNRFIESEENNMSIIINGNITINGNVNINESGEISTADKVSKAKDELLVILFYKRNSENWGGREAWIEMLDMYFIGDYESISERISTFKDGRSKAKALSCLAIIIANNVFSWQK